MTIGLFLGLYMKKIFLISISFVYAILTFAQFNGDGYYRIRNVGSKRYITITDDKGSVNIGSMSADLGAVKLFRSFENIVSNPASVLYVNEVNGQYRFESQGTDTHKIIGYDLKLKKNSDGSYKAYQEDGMRLYLCDARIEDTEEGVLSTHSESNNFRDWEIIPVSSENGNYFGITPEFAHDNFYYCTTYTSFAMTPASAGMTAYYISKVDNNIAVLTEIKGNAIPTATPIIIKTLSTEPAENKMEILMQSPKSISGNQLGGVYFHNTSKAHRNLTPYNPETMRVFGITSNNKLGFIKTEIENLPANKAYLKVPAGSPDELEIMTKDEYESYLSSINGVLDDEEQTKVYSLQGIHVATSQDRKNNLQGLPKGFYIINGRKVIVR